MPTTITTRTTATENQETTTMPTTISKRTKATENPKKRTCPVVDCTDLISSKKGRIAKEAPDDCPKVKCTNSKSG